MGIAASITCPTFSPEYAEATVNTTQRKTPQPIERGVSSAVLSKAGTGGSVFLSWNQRGVRVAGKLCSPRRSCHFSASCSLRTRIC